MKDDELTKRIIGAALEVHRTLGPRLLEAVYEECFCRELSEVGLGFVRQVAVPVTYKGTNLETGYRADVVIEGEVLVEIKAVERIMPVHEAQVLSYLRLGGFPKGLLINFHTKLLKDGIKRFVV